MGVAHRMTHAAAPQEPQEEAYRKKLFYTELCLQDVQALPEHALEVFEEGLIDLLICYEVTFQLQFDNSHVVHSA